ncbi:hypothetical protein P7B02_13215 [Caulobacter segnis]|uniref:hypothetical protein n=1 Tax=Caulobacter segnis TaxID=88688 RepID=UPI00241086C1|nr:hypothetical protein [Caulobacter segnis]MDG2522505.1 hypothetical protein [Caulobacter segnis]
MTFPIKGTGLIGWSLARRHPRLVLIWSVIQLAEMLVMQVVADVFFRPSLLALGAVSAGSPGLPAEAFPLLAFYGLYFPISYGIVFGAANRLILRPEDSGWAYLRLGRDEGRQVLVLLLAFAALSGTYLAAGIGSALLAVVIGLGATALGASWALMGIVAVSVAAMFVLVIWLSLRISLSSPDTFVRRKVSLKGSWRLTKGHVWRLLGVFFLATISSALLYAVVTLLTVGVEALLGGTSGAFDRVFSLDPSAPAFGRPSQMIMLPLSAVVSVVSCIVMITPAAEIYRRLAGQLDGAV